MCFTISSAKKRGNKMGWQTIIMIGSYIIEWVKDNAAFGKMEDFRTKKSNDEWKKGNIFEDGDNVMVVNVGGMIAGLIGMRKSLGSALKDDKKKRRNR